MLNQRSYLYTLSNAITSCFLYRKKVTEYLKDMGREFLSNVKLRTVLEVYYIIDSRRGSPLVWLPVHVEKVLHSIEGGIEKCIAVIQYERKYGFDTEISPLTIFSDSKLRNAQRSFYEQRQQKKDEEPSEEQDIRNVVEASSETLNDEYLRPNMKKWLKSTSSKYNSVSSFPSDFNCKRAIEDMHNKIIKLKRRVQEQRLFRTKSNMAVASPILSEKPTPLCFQQDRIPTILDVTSTIPHRRKMCDGNTERGRSVQHCLSRRTDCSLMQFDEVLHFIDNNMGVNCMKQWLQFHRKCPYFFDHSKRCANWLVVFLSLRFNGFLWHRGAYGAKKKQS